MTLLESDGWNLAGVCNMSQTDTTAAVLVNGDGQHYDESSIQLLQNRDHIRKRPANYIPDTSSRGLHHLVQ